MNIPALLQRPAIRYLLVGGSVYVLELIIILVAQRAGASPTWAVAIGFCIGTTVSFLLQKFFTFGDARRHHKVVAIQAAATIVLVIWNLGFSVGLTALLQDHLPAVVIRTFALAVTTIWNFYLYKTRIFRLAD